jgi:mycothiol synthase
VNVRAPSWDDLGEVARLVAACDIADLGRVETTSDDLHRDWRNPGLRLEHDAWLIELDGGLAGYAWLWERISKRPISVGYVHPGARGRGVGSALLQRIEQRARELDAELIGHYAVGKAAARLLRARGFQAVRHSFRMALDLDAPPTPAPPPDGVALRPFVARQDDRALHAALVEAFAEDPGFEPEPFERWRERRVADAGLDPDLWLLADDAGELAGFALTAISSEEGFVELLGVRARWRRLGLGYALLTRSFALLFDRGAKRVSLGVDAENPAGATRLYERARMHVVFRVDRYERTLR